MITPTSTDTKLSILLTNTNKALAEAIKSASPEQLIQLKEGKDIRSLLTSVFNETISASKSDQTLLDLLKNAPVFKNMGNVTEQLQSLLSKLDQAGDLGVKTSALETFLRQSLDLQSGSLKTQVANSGVFMESKIALAAQTAQTVSQTLETLSTLLSDSDLPEAKTLAHTITQLLRSPEFTHAAQETQSAEKLSTALQKIADSFRNILAKIDVLYSTETTRLSQRIDRLAHLQNDSGFSPNEVKSALSELYGILLKSTAPQTNTLLDRIELLLKNLNTSQPVQNSIADLNKFSLELHHAVENGDPAFSPTTAALVTKLGEFVRPETLLLNHLLEESLRDDLKSQLMKLSEEIQKLPDSVKSDLLDPINKVLTHIDYHQLLSHLNSSNSIYFPFAWDQLDEGSFSFKRNKEKKFYCEINLKLKEYGKLDLMMALQEENQVEIQAHTERSELKTLLEENLPALRSLLIEAGLTPRRIRVVQMNDSFQNAAASYQPERYGPDLGFEVKA